MGGDQGVLCALLPTPSLASRFPAPSAVRNLNVGNQTSSSITLHWDPPGDPDPQNDTYTYWVRCSKEGGQEETGSTTNVTYTVEGLEPASRYEFAVWVEGGGANSSEETLHASTGERRPGLICCGWFFCLYVCVCGGGGDGLNKT